ncbi:unnamed protein product, partial [Rotaria magnacalcarata]
MNDKQVNQSIVGNTNDENNDKEINEEIINFMECRKSGSKLKRQLTSTSNYDDEFYMNDDNINPFVLISNDNKRKQRINANNKETMNTADDNELERRVQKVTNGNGGRLFINSKTKAHLNPINDKNEYDYPAAGHDGLAMMNHFHTAKSNQPLDRNTKSVAPNKNNYSGKDNDVYISQQALHFAAEQHLPSIHIKCTPKLTDHSKGKEIVKALLTHIEKDFRKINKYYENPIGFEYWYMDKTGDLVCHAKDIELFVYLCDTRNYPNMVALTELSPSKPKHLPCKRSLIMKYVPNYITIDEIQSEVNLKIDTLFNIEELNGSKTTKNRHVRIEIKSQMEYEKLLKQDVMTIDGHLIEIYEFLAPPKLLLCSKCNEPGHLRKYCKLGYDVCKRCGDDRSNGNHIECKISCHRCKENHLSTDYKCQFLIEYRRSLLYQLKQKSYLLPPNVKLFIPTECRTEGDRYNNIVSNKIPLVNTTSNIISHKNDQLQQTTFNIKSHNWPLIDKNSNTPKISTQDINIWKELEAKQDEIKKLRNEINHKIKCSQAKYDEKTKKIKSILLVLSQQIKNQNDNIERCFKMLQTCIPLFSTTLMMFQKLTPECNDNDKNKLNDNYNEKSQYIQHIKNTLELLNEQNHLIITHQ